MPEGLAFATECIFRRTTGVLVFIGYDHNPLARAVERCNAHTESEVDRIALSTLPIFDEAEAYSRPALVIA